MRRLIALLFSAGLLSAGAVDQDSEVAQEILSIFQQYSIYQPPSRQDLPTSIEAVAARIRAVDPFFRYFGPDRAIAPDHAAVVRGLGGALVLEGEGLLFVPYQNGPAFAAGVQEPGYLLALAGHTTKNLSLENVLDIVASSEKRKTLEATIRTPAGKTTTYTIPLSPYQPPAVETIRHAAVPMIRIYEFAAGETVAKLKAALADLQKDPGPVMLDLRFSQGGSLFEALDSASLFLPAGLLLARTRDHTGHLDSYTSVDDVPVTKRPVVVLIGPNTISAAEVFVRALRHYGRVVTVGRRSYGKCVSQKLFPLSNGGRVKLTNLAILDPTGASCDGVGVDPDLLVPPDLLYETEALIGPIKAVSDARDGRVFVCEAQSDDTDPDIRMYYLRLMFPRLDGSYVAAAASSPGEPGKRRVCIGPFQDLTQAQPWLSKLSDGARQRFEAVEANTLHPEATRRELRPGGSGGQPSE